MTYLKDWNDNGEFSVNLVMTSEPDVDQEVSLRNVNGEVTPFSGENFIIEKRRDLKMSTYSFKLLKMSDSI